MNQAGKYTWVIFPAAGLLCLGPWGSPGLALGVGAALALMIENPFGRQGHKLSRLLLQVCVVMLGFGMDLRLVLAAGERGMLFAAMSILATFALGAWIGRWLGVGRMISLLVSAGTAICGGSAIAAVGAVSDADEGDMTVAIGTIFLLNAIALFAFPPIGHWLGMSSGEFGTWSGIAIHDISSVVGAASSYSNDALQTATAVKLSRSLWIIPVAGVVAWWFGRKRAIAADLQRETSGPQRESKPVDGHLDRLPVASVDHADAAGRLAAVPLGQMKNRSLEHPVNPSIASPARRMQMPWFIGLFLLASIIRTLSPMVAAHSTHIAQVARLGFTLALFLIGAGLSMKTLKAVGWRPLVQGVILWVFISVASVMTILWLG